MKIYKNKDFKVLEELLEGEVSSITPPKAKRSYVNTKGVEVSVKLYKDEEGAMLEKHSYERHLDYTSTKDAPRLKGIAPYVKESFKVWEWVDEGTIKVKREKEVEGLVSKVRSDANRSLAFTIVPKALKDAILDVDLDVYIKLNSKVSSASNKGVSSQLSNGFSAIAMEMVRRHQVGEDGPMAISSNYLKRYGLNDESVKLLKGLRSFRRLFKVDASYSFNSSTKEVFNTKGEKIEREGVAMTITPKKDFLTILKDPLNTHLGVWYKDTKETSKGTKDLQDHQGHQDTKGTKEEPKFLRDILEGGEEEGPIEHLDSFRSEGMRPCLTLLDKLGLDKGPYSMFIKVNDEGDASIDTSYAYGKYTNYEIASILSTISFKIKWYLEAYQEQLRAYINRGEYERGRSVGRDIVTLKKWLEDIKNFTK